VSIPQDKLQHIIGGAIVAAVFLALASVAGATDRKLMAAAALWAALIVGVGFELLQKFRREGEPDIRDAAATTLGGAITALAYLQLP
jgi:VanZ family protein